MWDISWGGIIQDPWEIVVDSLVSSVQRVVAFSQIDHNSGDGNG